MSILRRSPHIARFCWRWLIPSSRHWVIRGRGVASRRSSNGTSRPFRQHATPVRASSAPSTCHRPHRPQDERNRQDPYPYLGDLPARLADRRCDGNELQSRALHPRISLLVRRRRDRLDLRDHRCVGEGPGLGVGAAGLALSPGRRLRLVADSRRNGRSIEDGRFFGLDDEIRRHADHLECRARLR